MQIRSSQRLQGLYYVDLQQHIDHRGFFVETFKRSASSHIPEWGPVMQMNLSVSLPGVIRGLHYQEGVHAQGKLVICLQGKVFDVAVDMRPHSVTYGEWESVILEGPATAVFMAPGFAHGFEALGEQNSVHYLMTAAEYCPEAERGIAYDDPTLNIPWYTRQPTLSDKDRQWPRLRA